MPARAVVATLATTTLSTSEWTRPLRILDSDFSHDSELLNSHVGTRFRPGGNRPRSRLGDRRSRVSSVTVRRGMWRDRRGAGIAEYALLLLIIVIVGAVAFKFIGGGVKHAGNKTDEQFAGGGGAGEGDRGAGGGGSAASKGQSGDRQAGDKTAGAWPGSGRSGQGGAAARGRRGRRSGRRTASAEAARPRTSRAEASAGRRSGRSSAASFVLLFAIGGYFAFRESPRVTRQTRVIRAGALLSLAMATEALVARIKQILALAKAGNVDEAYKAYAQLYPQRRVPDVSDGGAAQGDQARRQHQDPAEPGHALADRRVQGRDRAAAARSSAARARRRTSSGSASASMVAGNEKEAGELFRTGLKIERDRNPQSDLCGSLMKWVAAV